MALSRRQKLTILALLFYWPTIFILAHIPIPYLVRKAGVSDKSLHYLAYLILLFLLWFAVSPDKKVSWRRAVAWWAFFMVAGYGALDEWLQGYITERSTSIADFWANLAGVVTGLILFSFFTFSSALLVVTAIAIFLLTNLTRVNLANLLPVTNALFYLFAYAIFTMLWIRHIPPPPLNSTEAKWLITALALPIGLLFTTKLFSVLSGRNFSPWDIIIASAATAVVVTANLLFYLFHRNRAQERSPSDT